MEEVGTPWEPASAPLREGGGHGCWNPAGVEAAAVQEAGVQVGRVHGAVNDHRLGQGLGCSGPEVAPLAAGEATCITLS